MPGEEGAGAAGEGRVGAAFGSVAARTAGEPEGLEQKEPGEH